MTSAFISCNFVRLWQNSNDLVSTWRAILR